MSDTTNPKGVADHPAKDQMEAIWRGGGRAKQIVAWLEEQGLPPVSEKTVARYGQRFWTEKVTIRTEDAEPEELNSFLEEIEAAGLGVVTKIGFSKKKYPGWEKIDGQNVQVDKESVAQTIEIAPVHVPQLSPARLPDIHISSPYTSTQSSRKPSKAPRSRSKPSGWSLAIVIPDPQIGFHRGTDGALTATHDEQALNICHQIALDLETDYGIDTWAYLGDNLDFASFTNHRSAPGYTGNTQLEIDRFGTEVAVARSIAQDAEIVALAGNHDNRGINTLVDKVPGLVGISKANTREPVLSIANLCRFDEYNIKYIESYPDGEYWLNDYLRLEHGTAISGTPGGTAAKHLAGSKVSTIFGHTHRQELVWTTINERHGARDIFAGTPGTTARVDGVLPSGQTGITSKGTQAGKKNEKWQQGLFVVWYQTGGAQEAIPEPVKIRNGKALYNGRIYEATVDPNGEKLV